MTRTPRAWYSTTDLARLLGCSPSTVAGLIDRGELPGFRAGNRRRVAHSVLVGYVAARPGLHHLLPGLVGAAGSWPTRESGESAESIESSK